jgi:hypothetical protein
MTKKPALLVDLDGTLCDIDHRLHLIHKSEDRPKKDWATFFRNMHMDAPHLWCVEIIRRFATDHAIIFCTGRAAEYENPTRDWIDAHLPWLKDRYLLLMRADKDFRVDTEVKRDLYMEIVRPGYDVLFALDDRARIAKMWRDECGLRCLHVEEGMY